MTPQGSQNSMLPLTSLTIPLERYLSRNVTAFDLFVAPVGANQKLMDANGIILKTSPE